jgi:hypothetical protein
MEASHRKAVFAAMHPNLREEPINDVLKRLTIGYVRVEVQPGSGWRSKQAAKRRLCEVESALVQRLAPPLNSATPSEAQGCEKTLDQVMLMVGDQLSRVTDGHAQGPVVAPRTPRETAEAAPLLADEDELDPMSVFLERVDDGTAAILRELQERCSVGNRFILYFTHGGRVARVSPTQRTGARNRPLITLEWRQHKEGVLLRSRLAPTSLRELGIADAVECSDQQMCSEVLVQYPGVTAIDILNACIAAEEL